MLQRVTMTERVNPIDGLDGVPWYAVAVNAARERVVAERLQDIGIHAVAPVYYRLVARSRHQAGKTPRRFPLVPGYVFAGVADWRHVLPVRDVIDVVGNGDDKTAIPYGVLSEFLSRNHEAELRPLVGIKVGDTVRIGDGPFRDFVGTVDRLKNYQARVLVEIFGRKTKTTFDVDDLTEVS